MFDLNESIVNLSDNHVQDILEHAIENGRTGGVISSDEFFSPYIDELKCHSLPHDLYEQIIAHYHDTYDIGYEIGRNR